MSDLVTSLLAHMPQDAISEREQYFGAKIQILPESIKSEALFVIVFEYFECTNAQFLKQYEN